MIAILVRLVLLYYVRPSLPEGTTFAAFWSWDGVGVGSTDK